MKYAKLALAILAILALAVPAFAGGHGHDTPVLNGTAAVTSEVGGGVMSGNGPSNFGLSFATQQSNNTSIAGFDTYKTGNEVGAMTYGSSTGSTSGFAIHGIVGGFQTGSYSASAWMSIPSSH